MTLTDLLLIAAGFLGGFVDAIAGGGGLITMPALLLAGLGPVAAIATNKAQSVCGTLMATATYASRGQIDLVARLPQFLMAALGGALGSLLAAVVPMEYLRAALPVALVAIAIYFILKPDPGQIDRMQRMSPLLLGMTVIPAIAFYDGVFGPGTGSFFTIAFISLAGYGLLKATAHTKYVNLASNFGSLIVFIAIGAVSWKIALMMAAAQIVGARLGANLALRSGARLIRPLLVSVCILMAGRLMWDMPWFRALIGM